MRHDWIVDMLADLQAFAKANELPDLARQLTEVLTLARHEIDLKDEAMTQHDAAVCRDRRPRH